MKRHITHGPHQPSRRIFAFHWRAHLREMFAMWAATALLGTLFVFLWVSNAEGSALRLTLGVTTACLLGLFFAGAYHLQEARRAKAKRFPHKGIPITPPSNWTVGVRARVIGVVADAASTMPVPSALASITSESEHVPPGEATAYSLVLTRYPRRGQPAVAYQETSGTEGILEGPEEPVRWRARGQELTLMMQAAHFLVIDDTETLAKRHDVAIETQERLFGDLVAVRPGDRLSIVGTVAADSFQDYRGGAPSYYLTGDAEHPLSITDDIEGVV